jgi:capsular polysaccharide export protein
MFNRFYNWFKVVLKLNQTLNELKTKIEDIQFLESNNQKNLSNLMSQVGQIQSCEMNNEKALSELKLQVSQIEFYEMNNEKALSELKLQVSQIQSLEVEHSGFLSDIVMAQQENASKVNDVLWRSHIAEEMLFRSTIYSRLSHNIVSDIFDRENNYVVGIALNKYDLAKKQSSINVLFGNNVLISSYDEMERLGEADVFIIWGIKPNLFSAVIANKALDMQKPMLICEDGFLRSILPYASEEADIKMQKSVSFTIDSKTAYYDSTMPSDLEELLNSDIEIDKDKLFRANSLINQIKENKLTKYNHQPIFVPNIGSKERYKVLVVDQSYGDYSIVKGSANESTFKHMLLSAIDEHPDADILVKIHPDALANSNYSGYFNKIKQSENIYLLSFEINPISLIEYVEHVYVVSTQLGFEAAMCGKKVSVFGLPFYSGWGITDDRQICARRIRKRSVEEIFYITYIMYSKYVNPKTGKICQIEEAIDYLLELREEYNNEQK